MAAGKKSNSRKKRMGHTLRRAAVALVIAAFALSIHCAQAGLDPMAALSQAAQGGGQSGQAGRGLRVYVLDVGQGDGMLLVSPSGRTMLIDSGESNAFSSIYSFLTGMGIERLDAVMATHPHSDHIGGMTDIINAFEIGVMYMPEADGMSATYNNMLEALESKGVDIVQVSAEGTPALDWDPEVELQVLSPFGDIAYEGLNDYSIILRAEHEGASMLFTGDAEGQGSGSAEYAVLARHTPDELKSSVLKVGHHGSFTSTSEAFLAAVDPEYAVISVGEDNQYGHPSASVLSRLEEQGCDIFRTDKQGHILVELEGETAFISPVEAPSQSAGDIALDAWALAQELWQPFIGIFE